MSTKTETLSVGSNRKVKASLIVLFIVLFLMFAVAAIIATLASRPAGDPLTYTLSEPLGSAASAKIEVDPGDGNLVIDSLTGGEPLLASGTLQYLEDQEPPTTTMVSFQDQTTFTINASGGQRWSALPWAACNGATDWQIHLNPSVPADLTAHTDGGNVSLNLSGTAVTRVSADSGGGDMDVVLPEGMNSLSADVKTGGGNITVAVGSGLTGSGAINASTGAGNVIVTVPDGAEARIHVTSGMGKVIVDERFSKIDDTTYQTPGYENAVDKVEITASSGAGNVEIRFQ